MSSPAAPILPVKLKVPAYRLHKPSGRAVVTLNYQEGGRTVRRDVPLGIYGTAESWQEYNRVVADYLARNRTPEPPATESDVVTVEELWWRFWEGRVAKFYLHPDGTPTSEQATIRQAGIAFRSMYGDVPVDDLTPPMVKTWLHAVTRPTRIILELPSGKPRELKGWCRNSANKHLSRIKLMFKWGMTEGKTAGSKTMLVRPDVYAAICAVEGLKRGRCDARETKRVRPVDEDFVAAIKPYVSDQVWAMAQLQVLTGARSGELCIMRTADVDTTGRRIDPEKGKALWVYRPAHHKGSWRQDEDDEPREILLGDRCQDILRPFLRTNLQAFVFSPTDAEAKRRADLHTARTTPEGTGNGAGDNRADLPAWKPGDRYTPDSFRRAIQRGCEKAFPLPAHLERLRVPASGRKAKAATRFESEAEWQARLGLEGWAEVQKWRREHRFHPHQSRHTRGTRVRERFGVEGAQVALGHKHANVTQIYAERSGRLASRIAAEMG